MHSRPLVIIIYQSHAILKSTAAGDQRRCECISLDIILHHGCFKPIMNIYTRRVWHWFHGDRQQAKRTKIEGKTDGVRNDFLSVCSEVKKIIEFVKKLDVCVCVCVHYAPEHLTLVSQA